MKPNTNNNVSSNTKKKSKLKEANPKDKDKELENKRLIRCKICLNPSTKTTLNFSCNHNLCGICVAHFLIQCDFSCLSEKKTIKIDCPICKIGSIDTSLEEINKVLDETHQTRTQKKKDICATHKKLAEDYCIECKKWLCGECKKIFHDSYFKDHNLVPEVPFEFKKCKNHDDNKKDLFCTSCSEEICHFCNRKGESHEGHPIMTLMEYKDHVLDCKKEYKYQKFEVFDNFLTELEVEFTEKFNNSFNKKKELIDEITKLLETITKEYLPKKEEKKKFIKNYFEIIRCSYYNYFHDLKVKDPLIDTLNFINSINKEILSINFDSEYTEDLEKIRNNLQLIDVKKFFKYEMEFTYHTLNLKKTIKKQVKKDGNTKTSLRGQKNIKKKETEDDTDHIYCLIQLKDGNIVTGGSKGVLEVWDLKSLKKVDSFNAHTDNIYSVIQLSDGKLVSASADLWIKIWDFANETQPEPKVFDIIDKNKLEELKKKKLTEKSKKHKNKLFNDFNNDSTKLRSIPQPIKPDINNNINTQNISPLPNNNSNSNTVLFTNDKNNSIINNNINSNIINPYQNNPYNNPNNNVINANHQNQNNINYTNNINQESNKINDNSKAPDISYSGAGNYTVLNKVPDVSYGDHGVSNTENKAPDGVYSGNGNFNPINKVPDVSYGDHGTSNTENKAPDGGYSGNGNFNPINKVPDVSYGDHGTSNKENKAPDGGYSGMGNFNPENKAPDGGYSGMGNFNPENKAPDGGYSGMGNFTAENKPKDSTFGGQGQINLNSLYNNNINNNINNMNNMLNNMNNNISEINNINNNNIEENKNSTINNSINVNNNIKTDNIEAALKKKSKEKFKESEIDFEEDIKEEIIPSNPPKNNSNSEDKKAEDVGFSSNQGKIIINENGTETVIDGRSNRCLIALRAHYEDVFCLLETSKKQLVSCSKDGTILIWSIDNQSVIYNFKGHNNSVGCVIELKEDKIATGGSDCKIKVWDISSYPNEEDYVLIGHKNGIFCICKINENVIASASCDKTIRLWDLENRKCTHIFEGHTSFVWSIVKLTDNKIASASSDKTIKIWDISEKKCINNINAHDNHVTVLCLLQDNLLASGSINGEIKIWEC